jgi:hypothetical protein
MLRELTLGLKPNVLFGAVLFGAFEAQLNGLRKKA